MLPPRSGFGCGQIRKLQILHHNVGMVLEGEPRRVPDLDVFSCALDELYLIQFVLDVKHDKKAILHIEDGLFDHAVEHGCKFFGVAADKLTKT